MRDPQDYNYWHDKATRMWDEMRGHLATHNIPLTFVIKTDFIRWLSDDATRTEDYLERDDISHLITNYSHELIETDENS